jgi:hypothetical protein
MRIMIKIRISLLLLIPICLRIGSKNIPKLDSLMYLATELNPKLAYKEDW